MPLADFDHTIPPFVDDDVEEEEEDDSDDGWEGEWFIDPEDLEDDPDGVLVDQ